MDASTHEKTCPRCNTRAYLTATKCEKCGREYKTVFAEEQTTTFARVNPAVLHPPPEEPRLATLPPLARPPAPAPYTGGIDGPAVALILGCFSIGGMLLPIIGIPLAIGAIVTAARVMSVAGDRRGVATAGLVCGIIGLLLGGANAGMGAYQGATGQLWFQRRTPPLPDANDPTWRTPTERNTAPLSDADRVR